uniref:Wall-associated receptor kinase galacturonan-binding domain-containing protein n=1 Tax=Oryza brachyantha TaxID=4533 RepID=J3NF03_ORYBR
MAMPTTTSEPAISLPGCPDKCGDVSIPYPFGIGAGCALSSYFTITCNDTFQPPRPMLRDMTTTMEVINISLERGEVRIYGPVSYTCFTSNTTILENYTTGFTLEDTPFIPSTTRNRFMAIGSQTLGIIGGYMHMHSNDLYVAGCYSYCQGINSTSNGAPCTGMGCCETTIIPDLKDYAAILVMNQSAVWSFTRASMPCL